MRAPFYLREFQKEIIQQLDLKRSQCEAIMGQPAWHVFSPHLLHDRSKLDLMWWEGKLGIRGPRKHDNNFDFIEIKQPDCAAPPILDMMEDLLTNPPPFNMAQLRFRYSAHGDRGLWIDMANVEIKNLIGEANWLRHFIDYGWIIEIGQKNKAVVEDSWQIKLGPAPLINWLNSYDKDNSELSLKSQIAMFSQPGPEANRALIASAMALLDEHNCPDDLSWVEYGAGYGNLSAALYGRLGEKALISEYDPSFESALRENQKIFFSKAQLQLKPAHKVDLEQTYQLWLIDPPRPGFSNLLKNLNQTPYQQPDWVLAFHCHQKGLNNDTHLLREKKYQLQNWILVDNFPATPHAEVISLWQRLE